MFLVLFFEVSGLGHHEGKGLGLEVLRPFLFWALMGALPFFFDPNHSNLNGHSYAKQELSVQPGMSPVPGRAPLRGWLCWGYSSPSIGAGLRWHGGGCPLPGRCWWYKGSPAQLLLSAERLL